ncbi:MAG TPA: dienelactone hydrolase family protein [Acidimicrobiales bacterium]|nr:dienelactone hydrolase family protein [Acidimicrobiales bacterium]
MGSIIEFTSATGTTVEGYLAEGPAGAPGIVVIQEWWGLVPQIEATCDRYAEAGFTALAPDLYGGTKVPLDEPDEAGKAMMSLKVAQAAADLSGAVDALVSRTGRPKVGAIGYCMGGGLTLKVGADRPDAVGAVVDCYGLYAWDEGAPDFAALGPVQVHCAARDEWVTPEKAAALVSEITSARESAEVELFVYEGADHAFANEERPEVYDAAAAALLFERSTAFFSTHL